MFYRKQADPVNQVYRRLVPLFHTRPAALTNPRPMVSFTFDDFPRSAAVHGSRILEAHGGRGTFYLSAWPESGSAAELDPVCGRELERLVRSGHELACHTFTHVDCALTGRARLEHEIAANQAHVSELLPGYRLRNFAYPYGNVSVAAKRRLGARFRSCRGIRLPSPRRMVDLSLLPAQPLFGRGASVDMLKRLLDDNAGRVGWLIFFTHDIAAEPSAFGTTPRAFEQVVQQAARTGSELLTVDGALDRLLDVPAFPAIPAVERV